MSSICIVTDNLNLNMTAPEDMTILSLLQRENIPIMASCGGIGTCGKCKVLIEQNGEKSIVLACRTKLRDNMTIYVKSDFIGKIETDIQQKMYDTDGLDGYGVAVDIGTTTVVIRLYSLKDGTAVATRSVWNVQSVYGADVISRIQYILDNDDGLFKESDAIQNQIEKNIKIILKEKQINAGEVKQIFVSGNTVMQHIFAGISPSGIAVAPFKPETLFDNTSFVLPGFSNAKVYFSPCVSGYVGGDIVSGVLSTGIYNTEKLSLFLDIGTNGEMVLGNKNELICCSVATGPAFEGAGITCGMLGINGAVSHVEYDGNFHFETIGDENVAGICGSGIIDLLAILLENGIVDETGRMLSPDEVSPQFSQYIGEDEDGNGIFYISKENNVFFTARDVRKIQLAKASVMAGIKVLVKSMGIGYTEIDNVYIAGGFGANLNIKNSALIGMIPRELIDRVECVGNTSLSGRSMALLSHCARENLIKIRDKCGYIELSTDSNFADEYIEQMIFENSEVKY